jgi:bifunctional non-homologous end joining protein LigD
MLERQRPELIVADMAKNLRVGKVFIDWSQNADHKTTVGVYSLRAKRERPFVSMPLRWNELERAAAKSDRAALSFTPAAALQRLKKVGDLFAPMLKLKQKLPEQFVSRIATGPINPALRAKRNRALSEYDAKRNFEKTSEPASELPRRSRQGGRRRFVVQKHAASHLHYDFRLEMHDVLKSWAVPRRLPTKSADVRSAFETEDHPIEYLNFEGVIPEGQYGGGTVMVWDIGTYDIVEGNYWTGSLNVFLTGKKLKGEWTLRRAESENGKTKWLLLKSGGNAKAISATRENKSAVSGRTMEQIASERSAVWQSNRSNYEVPNGRARLPASLTKHRGGRRLDRVSPHPRLKFIAPMKATAVEKLPQGAEWIYEVKWDGYRALALKDGANVRLLSAKNRNLTTDFPDVTKAVAAMTAEVALIDGEIVAVNAEGKPSFQVLQNRATMGRDWLIVYYAFDLLNLEGDDLTKLTLEERKAKLRKVIGNAEVRYSAELSGSPLAIVSSIQQAGLEGVVAKRRDSIYQARTRSSDWLKLRLGHSQEFVIGGYNPDADTFQSLLVGYYKGGKLMFAGKVRQGFSPAGRRKLFQILAPFATDRCPFANLPSSKRSHFGEGVTADDMKKLRWLKPKLVAQVRFAEWTNYGLLRHATYLGLRDDKKPREVHRE